ncbi:MAG: M28 family peptidase [Deltaproteobacteria bacterium]|nr:MAG: M28 family peptidase [Deltaproteobacteria bacterium]
MRIQVVAIALLIGCHGGSERPGAGVDAGGAVDEGAPATGDLEVIFDEVDGARITQVMRELSGEVPVTVNGTSIMLGERFDDIGRQKFRDYWTQTMQNLGLEIKPLHYQAAGHPRPGDDVEAILRGPSADSVIVIVHYDSIGPVGSETSNPGADDDMSGMSIMLETARLFVKHRSQLALTVRFVASDEEEVAGLAGARAYAAYIKALSQSEGFALVAAVDVFSCGRNATSSFDFPALGDQFAAIVASYSTLHVKRGCIGANSDHFAMWEIGVPAVVYSEHNPFANPHFDEKGGDVFARIDLAYLTSIARPAIAFQAALAGVQK